ncbi:hypothetical protein [Henriciella sp.]|uniref:hypothetical protein n=1 Tax=Henriciella sp. TaxID=1968823 RepID=UPI00260A058D|nr:hypothetical protein [Henriciella sp.]
MTGLRLLAVSAATGRIGYVFFVGHELVQFDLSRKGFKSPNDASEVFQNWIKMMKPDVVVTERLPAETRKGKRAIEITKTFALVASHHCVHDVSVAMDREGRTRFEQASHLAQIYPDIAYRLPRKPRFYESEDRAMILFDALTLAHLILESPALRLAAGMDKPTDDRDGEN